MVPVHVPGRKRAWACIVTKKPDAVYLYLFAPQGRFTQGQITGLGLEPMMEADRPGMARVRLKFRMVADLERGDLAGFVKEHLAAVREGE